MEPPVPPSDSDCCNSGCNPCILEVYEAQLKKYQQYLKNGPEQLTEFINSIDPLSYTKFILTARKQISLTVFLLTFEYADVKENTPNCFKCIPGQYLLLRGKDHEGEFTRAYTPIPVPNDPNLGFTILVRIYENGRMSKMLKKLQLKHVTYWRGSYGDFSINYKYRFFLFVAQGTGIAPVFAIINETVHNEDCESFIKLFFCCRNNEEILLRDELYKLTEFWNFSCEIFLSNSENIVKKYNETVHEHKLSSSDLELYIKEKQGKLLQVIICGSESFNGQIKSEVENLGIESSHIYLF